MKSFLKKARFITANCCFSALLLGWILVGCSGNTDTNDPSDAENTRTVKNAMGGWLGVEFGTVKPESESCDINNEGSRVYKFEPKNGFREFSEFMLFATPMSRQVYQVRAVRILDSSNWGNPREEFDDAVKQLEKEFGCTFIRGSEKEAIAILSLGNFVTVNKQDDLLGSLIFVDVFNSNLMALSKKETAEAEAEHFKDDLVTLALKPGKNPDTGKVSRVLSVFGVAFGEPFSKGGRLPDQNDAGAWVYTFDPGSRFMGYSEFFAFATAASEKVFMVRTCYEGTDEADAKAKYDQTKRLIENATGRSFKDDDEKGLDEGCSMQFGDVHVSMTKNWMRNIVMLDFCRVSLYLQNEQETKDRGSTSFSARKTEREDSDSGESFDEAVERLLGPKVHAEDGEGSDAVAGIIDGLVSIPGKPWKIGKYEVSQAQWMAVMGHNPSRRNAMSIPVDNVSYADCKEFVEKLNALPATEAAGLVFRLPTGEEWEYACRAGGTGSFCRLDDGTDIDEESLATVAWFGDNADFRTHSRGIKRPNAFGLFDMLGNVCEWTQPEHGQLYARGGSYDSVSIHCTADRKSGPWDYNDSADGVGFRLAAESKGSTIDANPGISDEDRKVIESIIAQLVRIPGKDYYFGKYEVSTRQWESVMGAAPNTLLHLRSVASGLLEANNVSSDYPIESISWNEISEFIEKLNSHPVVRAAGYTFRLPTRREWQHACRAGSAGDYCISADGNEINAARLSRVAWFDYEKEDVQPVGGKMANAYGLFDMLGNVAEWVADGSGSGFHYICGGGYDSPLEMCNAGYSDDGIGSAAVGGIGFRLCAEKTTKTY